jgi:hypothetical protein
VPEPGRVHLCDQDDVLGRKRLWVEVEDNLEERLKKERFRREGSSGRRRQKLCGA